YAGEGRQRATAAHARPKGIFITCLVSLDKCDADQSRSGRDGNSKFHRPLWRGAASASSTSASVSSGRDHLHAFTIDGDFNLMLVSRVPGDIDLEVVFCIERKIAANAESTSGPK